MKAPMIMLSWCLASIGFATRAQKVACTQEQANQAEAEIDSLKDWDGMHRFYQQLSRCDDGGIAEGYSDAVGKLLANSWEHFDRFASLVKVDKGFQRFVLKHIDDTLPASTLQQIASNARSHCPSGSKQLCQIVARAASRK